MGKIECNCQKCVDCCWNNPGWFGSIEEIEGAAKLKRMSVVRFCREYLIREWLTDDDGKRYEIPSPRRDFRRFKGCSGKRFLSQLHKNLYQDEAIGNGKGFVLASWSHNLIHGSPCVFLRMGKCTIHSSKPKECAMALGCQRKGIPRRDLLGYWKKHQDWIKDIVKKIGETL